MSAQVAEAAPTYVIHEQAALACPLVDEATYDAMAGLRPEHFALPLHAVIWQAMMGLRTDGHPLSPATVGGRVAVLLAHTPELWAVAREYIPRLAVLNPVPIGAEYHAERVRTYALVRAIGEKAERIAMLAEADDVRAVAEAEALAHLAAAGTATVTARSVGDVVQSTLDDIEARRTGAAGHALTTGLPTLAQLNAFLPGDFVLLAARPSVGKSLLGFQIALHAAAMGARGLFVSLEMSNEQLMLRALAQESQVPPRALALADLQDAEWMAVMEAGERIRPRPLDMLDAGDLTLDTILSVARRLKATRGLAFVVIDYLQLLPMPSVERVKELEALTAITKRLKATARQLAICIIGLSQLSREGDGDRPGLRHLRGSGSLEQDADTVLLLWPNTEKGEDGWKAGLRHLVLDVRKNRNGPTTAVDLIFNPANLLMGEVAR